MTISTEEVQCRRFPPVNSRRNAWLDGPRRRKWPAIDGNKARKPVALVIRVESRDDEIFGFLAGKGRIVGDIENTIPLSDWNLPE